MDEYLHKLQFESRFYAWEFSGGARSIKTRARPTRGHWDKGLVGLRVIGTIYKRNSTRSTVN